MELVQQAHMELEYWSTVFTEGTNVCLMTGLRTSQIEDMGGAHSNGSGRFEVSIEGLTELINHAYINDLKLTWIPLALQVLSKHIFNMRSTCSLSLLFCG